jgi:hypothetical protein
MRDSEPDRLNKFKRGAMLPFREREAAKDAEPKAAEDGGSPAVTLAVLIGFLVALVVGGVWLMNTLRDISRIQDCAMQGRRNCAPIEVPRER